MLNQFDTQVQCEEFYKEEFSMTQELAEEIQETEIVSVSTETHLVELIKSYEKHIQELEDLVTDSCIWTVVHTQLDTFKTVVKDLKHLVPEAFIEEPADNEVWVCGSCPGYDGDTNSCDGRCGLEI